MGTSYTTSFRPVYFIKTIFLTSDVFVKEVKEVDEDGNPVKDLASEFITELKEDEDFMFRTGWRVKNSTYGLSGVYVRDPQ